MTAYRKDLDETNYVSFLIKDDKLLEKYNEIWDKLRNTIRKESDSNPVYNKKYLRAKMKSYNGKKTNFHYNKLSKKGSQFIFLSVISIDSVFKTGKKYYPQVFLEECNYVIKEGKIHNYVTDDLEISSDSNEEILDKNQIKKNSDEGDSNKEKILMKKILMKNKILMRKKNLNITNNYLTIEEIII